MGTSDSLYIDTSTVKSMLGLSGTIFDSVIDDMTEQASRVIDDRTGTRFYTPDAMESRLFDVPDGPKLTFDEWVTEIGTVTNGNGDVIPATDYILLPANESPKCAIKLRPSKGHVWETGEGGESEQIITIVARWGYSDEPSPSVKRAATALVSHWFGKRGAEGVTRKRIGQFEVQFPDATKSDDIPGSIAGVIDLLRKIPLA